MSFTHRLRFRSRSAARLLRWSTAFGGLLACDRSTLSLLAPVAGRDPVVTIMVVPDSVSLRFADTVRFLAHGRTLGGDSVAVDVSWSAEGGTISGTGQFVAGSVPGDYRVVSTLVGGTLSGTARARISKQPPPVHRVEVRPERAELAPGATEQLSVVLSDWTGQPISDREVEWTSTAEEVATVSPGGLVTAIAPGTARIIARAEETRDSAMITVVRRRVASVSVTPSHVILPVSQTKQLTATVTDSAGAVLSGRTVNWSSDNTTVATVSQGGLVTAVAPGHATINATSEGIAGQATVSVPPSGPGPCANPAPAWIWCDDFEEDRLASYFEYNPQGGSFVRAPGVGRNGSSGMRARFAIGQVEAGALHVAFGRTPHVYMRPVDAGTSDYRELYWRMYLRHQPGWIGGGGYKLSRAMILATGNFAQAMIAHVWSEILPLTIDPASGTDSSGTLRTTKYNDFARLRWLGLLPGVTPIFDAAHVGRWYCIEAQVRLNDAGQSNGTFRLWVDGALEAQHADLNWVGSYDAYGINAVYLENYWNGGSPQAQERYMDEFVVSTERIGC